MEHCERLAFGHQAALKYNDGYELDATESEQAVYFTRWVLSHRSDYPLDNPGNAWVIETALKYGLCLGLVVVVRG